MKKTLIPGQRYGEVFIPSSKSLAHRIYICAALSKNQTKVLCKGISKDIAATINCMKVLTNDSTDTVSNQDSNIDKSKKHIFSNQSYSNKMISDLSGYTDHVVKSSKDMINISTTDNRYLNLYCGESASTLRFLLPIVGALGKNAVFHLEGRLPARPIFELINVLNDHGMSIEKIGNEIYCSGKLTAGDYYIRGDVSSQYISGLMFGLPLLAGDSNIIITTQVESLNYTKLTIDVLKKAGISIQLSTVPFTAPRIDALNTAGISRNIESKAEEESVKTTANNNISEYTECSDFSENYNINNYNEHSSYIRYHINGSQIYNTPAIIEVEGDWSNAAAYLCMGALSDKGVTVYGLNTNSLQGDKEIVEILKKYGCSIVIGDNSVTVNSANKKISLNPKNISGTYTDCTNDNANYTNLKETDLIITDYLNGNVENINSDKSCYSSDSSISHNDISKIIEQNICNKYIEIDAKNIPDLIPYLAVVACVKPFTTRIINANRLRLKESDRLKSTMQLLSSLGANIKETADGLLINGKSQLSGGEVDSYYDHRIAMAAAIAACVSNRELILYDTECVEKSYPSFWEDYEMLEM